jgi:hypothetical protein
MWGILISAGATLLEWCLGGSVMGWIASTITWAFGTISIGLVIKALPSWFNVGSLSNSFSALTPQMWYFMDYFQAQTALQIVFTAFTARFVIRRIRK